MRLQLRAVGTRMPRWVNEAVREYEVRLPKAWRFELRELPAARSRVAAAVAVDEGARLLKGIDDDAMVIALDEQGEPLDTAGWAGALGEWQRLVVPIVMLIGGSEGLSPACRSRAGQCWSLSRLTLPHGLARVTVVEQLYRASTVLAGHPYHRAGRAM